jgi:uncharacterized membrane protein
MSLRHSQRLPFGTKFLMGAFTVSGVFHLIRPESFYALIPPMLGSPWFWAVSSGVVELVCAFALWRRFWWAPQLTAAVLLIIWVGNWWFAIDSIGGESLVLTIVAFLRLPLQIPMIRWALASPVR